MSDRDQRIKTHNEKYREQRQAEGNRRRETGLVFTSKHYDTLDHWASQQEFISWVVITFGREAYPIWWHGSSSKHWDYQTHTWLLAKKEHLLMAKLRWG